jgi:DNA helicase HerA-like ATPase
VKPAGKSRETNSPKEIRKIGTTVVSDTLQINMDNFWFLVDKDSAVAPFDFISAKENGDSKSNLTVGIVNDLQVIPQESSKQHRIIDEHSLSPEVMNNSSASSQSHFLSEKGASVAKVTVLAKIEKRSAEEEKLVATDMPVMSGRAVRFATVSEVIDAQEVLKMERPIPAGIIEMSNGTQIPISLDITYLAGPNSAHVNAASISGNLKTSYLLFLLHSVYQTLTKNNNLQSEIGSTNPATIIFNTRDDDLLHVDEVEENLPERDRRLFEIMNLKAEPFRNVTYLLPRGKDGRPNSVFVPKNSRTYSFELEDVFDRLELLFAETLDPYYDSIYSLASYIAEAWPLFDSSRKTVKTWSDLAAFKEYPAEIVTHRSSFVHFLAYLQRFRKSPLFVDKRRTSIYLGKAIKQITAGDVYVVDLARIPTLEEQALVVGDVMRSIVDMHSYAARSEPVRKIAKEGNNLRPDYLFIFIDEINRFLPKSRPERRIPATADQITRTVIAGKSRNTILFSAQQFECS